MCLKSACSISHSGRHSKRHINSWLGYYVLGSFTSIILLILTITLKSRCLLIRKLSSVMIRDLLKIICPVLVAKPRFQLRFFQFLKVFSPILTCCHLPPLHASSRTQPFSCFHTCSPICPIVICISFSNYPSYSLAAHYILCDSTCSKLSAGSPLSPSTHLLMMAPPAPLQ